MTESNIRNFNQQLPLITGFLGGLTFTVLTSFIDKIHDMKLGWILIPLISAVSVLFILASLGTIKNPTKGVAKNFYFVIISFIFVGFFGILLIIPMLIYNYDVSSSYIITIFEIIAVIIYWKTASKNPAE